VTAVPGLRVRPTTPADAAELCDLINVIIRVGGTTAIEEELDEATFRHWFVDGDHVIVSFVAEGEGRLLGFQSLSRYGDLPEGWGDIGTFVRQPGGRGVGTALFSVTRDAAKAAGLVTLNATIRADNVGGLAFYARCGFRDYRIDPGVPLKDGTPVDRIRKVYRLTPSAVDKAASLA
jgi:Acetyltransferases, including N-acetylases of ribosomal proteins